MPSLLRSLLTVGVLANDADTLERTWGNTDPGAFLDGLEQIARLLVTKEQPGLLPPSAEPWKSIFNEIRAVGDADQGFNAAAAKLDPAVQVAVIGATTSRMNDLRNWLSQQAQAGRKRKIAQYAKAVENLGYKVRYNLCSGDFEVNGRLLTDNDAEAIRAKLRDINIHETNVAEEAYRTYACEHHAYHPIRDYLLNLQFQGGDPIGDLAAHFQDEYNMFSTWLRRWCIGSVARVMGAEQNRTLIIDGPQGCGKSQFVRWLAGGLPEYFYEGAIMPEDKDCRMRRATVWIWEVNEFGSTVRRADREALKAFLTTQTIRERRPYGRRDFIAQAAASFIGTVNNEMGLLSDPTGNRRFMVSHITGIDWAYAKNIDVDQVWAQAFDLYLKKEPWNLTPGEVDEANKINDLYQMVDIVEETVKKYFEVDATQPWWTSTLEILDVLKDPGKGNLKGGSEIDTRKLAAALTRLGLEKPQSKRVHNNVIRGYYGIQRKLAIP